MGAHVYQLFSRWRYRILLLLPLISIISIMYYCNRVLKILPATYMELKKTTSFQIDSVLDVIDIREESSENITCIKSKDLPHIGSTTICLHNDRDAVSNIIQSNRIWEEPLLVKILGALIRYPHMDFIDVGANLGTYTMFAASLGRSVLSIECFKPNIERIRRAIQMEKVQDKVILVGNAIYNESGKYLKMTSSPHNIGSQEIIPDNDTNRTNNDVYVVKTIRFDDLLPVLKKKNIRHAVMKVDIQWSEVYLCETGGKIFDYVNIPVILMEWERVMKHLFRMSAVLHFFLSRGYVATADMCKVLEYIDAFRSWPADIFWIKMNQSEFC